MATYTSKFTTRNNTYLEKFARGLASAFGFARFGRSKFGYSRTSHTSKFSTRNNTYTAKYV